MILVARSKKTLKRLIIDRFTFAGLVLSKCTSCSVDTQINLNCFVVKAYRYICRVLVPVFALSSKYYCTFIVLPLSFTMSTTKRTRYMAKTPRIKKTAADLKADFEAAKRKLATLEAKAYEGELLEAVSKSTIVAEFNKIKARYKDVGAVNILQAIGKAVKIPRVVTTQAEAKTRTKKTS